MRSSTPTTTAATTPPRIPGLRLFSCAPDPDPPLELSDDEAASDVGVGVSALDAEFELEARQLESLPVCTKNGGDCTKMPAVRAVSNATAT